MGIDYVRYDKALQALNLRLALHKDLRGLVNQDAALILDCIVLYIMVYFLFLFDLWTSISDLSNKMGNVDYAILAGFAALRLSNGYFPPSLYLSPPLVLSCHLNFY